jgi:hypothetical protein
LAIRSSLFVPVLGLLLGAGCGGDTGGMPPGPLAFRVAVTEGNVGGPATADRLDFSLTGTTFTLDIEALPAAAFGDGWVAIRSQPGDVISVEAPGAIRSNVPLVGGRVTGVRVTIAKAFGDTRLWAEDLGFVPGPAAGSACNNGIDDDGDGRTDYPDDPGCSFSNDDTETEGSMAVGLSPTLYFANPRIADVQGLTSVPPLVGRSITVDEGDLFVTAVMVDGLVVTDIAETRGYQSILAYNYNTPSGIRVCDKVDSLSGIVGEFLGMTELGFPSWTRNQDWPRPLLPSGPAECPIPDAIELTATMAVDLVAMESLESSLVQVTGATVSSRFENCDYNGNGNIEYTGPEDACTVACNLALDCTELTSFDRYGQFNVTSAPDPVSGEQQKVLVVARGAAPDFDVRANAGATVPLIRGILYQVAFLDQPWIIELRCRDDLVLAGETSKPIYQACVSPPDDEEDYTR